MCWGGKIFVFLCCKHARNFNYLLVAVSLYQLLNVVWFESYWFWNLVETFACHALWLASIADSFVTYDFTKEKPK
jgi:hypothetical protein